MNKIQRFRTFLIPLAGFILILLAMNGYQYFKLKKDFAANIVKKVSTDEIWELRSYLKNIEQQLRLIREWGLNDVLVDGELYPGTS